MKLEEMVNKHDKFIKKKIHEQLDEPNEIKSLLGAAGALAINAGAIMGGMAIGVKLNSVMAGVGAALAIEAPMYALCRYSIYREKKKDEDSEKLRQQLVDSDDGLVKQAYQRQINSVENLVQNYLQNIQPYRNLAQKPCNENSCKLGEAIEHISIESARFMLYMHELDEIGVIDPADKNRMLMQVGEAMDLCEELEPEVVSYERMQGAMIDAYNAINHFGRKNDVDDRISKHRSKKAYHVRMHQEHIRSRPPDL